MGGDPPGGFLDTSPPAPPIRRLDEPRKSVQLPPDMADRIVSERMAPSGPAADFSRNLSVARIEVKDPKTGAVSYEHVSAWNLEKQHAEPLVLEKVAKRKNELKGKTVTITHLYTERVPCSSGRADCQWALKQKNVPRSNIYYSVEVPDGQLAKKLESHYAPYRRNIPRPPGRGRGVHDSPPKTPRPKPKGPRRAGKAAAGALAATLGSAQPQTAAAARAVDEPAAIDRATKSSQRMVDPPAAPTRITSRGTANRGVPPPPSQPRVLTSPPSGAPAPSASASPPKPVIAEKGERSNGRVTLSYDFTSGSQRDSVRMKSVDASDFFRKESRITRVIKAPALRKLAAATAPTAASLLTGWGLGKIKEHFSAFIQEARRNFDRAFPPGVERGDELDLEEQKATYDVIVDELGQPTPIGALKLSAQDIVRVYLFGMFEYERVNLELQDGLARDLGGDLPDAYEDIRDREQVLSRISNNLEDAFIWIHSHAFGAIPIVYYQSFDLWLVRDIFHDLAGEMSSLQSHIYDRQAEYRKLLDKLVDDLEAAGPWLNYYRTYYERHKNLLPAAGGP